jgi:phosphoglycerol transferase MdoB-like AlkP superfamily enzyme
VQRVFGRLTSPAGPRAWLRSPGGLSAWLRSPAGVLTATFLFTLVLALIANLVLELSQGGGDVAFVLRHTVIDDLPLLLLGTLVVWLFVLLVLSVLGRLWLTVGVIAVGTVLLGYANHRKIELLLEPLYPSDLTYLSHLDFLTQMVGGRVVLALTASLAVLLALALLAGRVAGRVFPPPDMRQRRVMWTMISIRIGTAFACLAALGYVMQFHSPGNLLRAGYDEYGAHWTPWHQSRNYTENGFVGGMLYNLPVPAMSMPEGYSEATMGQIAATYSAAADRINRSRDPAALDDVNVVFVLSEAFSDPTMVKTLQLAEDPIPYTHALMERTTSGNLLARKYGGGTANTEFEVLTGMSLSLFQPQLQTPFQMLVPNYERFPSAAYFFRDRGLGAVAMHAHTPALYRRTQAYPILGFEDSLFRDDMTHTDTLEANPFVSDESTFQETLDQLREADDPMFLHVVTMQNHFPTHGKYAQPIPVSGLEDEDVTTSMEHYARGLRYSDDALRHFILALDLMDERTIVVFYGDHQPAMNPPPASTRRARHETPFFIYSNFGRALVERLPTTSPTHFVSHVLERANAYVAPYHALLAQLEQEIPAMQGDFMIGPDNRRLWPEELTPRARRILHDYELVQFDLSVGQRYAEEELFDLDSTPAVTRRADAVE